MLNGLETEKGVVLTAGLPLVDAEGNALTYAVIETEAPNGFWNRIYLDEKGNVCEGRNGAFVTMDKETGLVSCDI